MAQIAPPPLTLRSLTGTPMLFAAATLGPGALIVLAAVFGGLWPLAALLAMTALVAALDRLVAQAAAGVPGAEFPASDRLSVALACLHLALVPLTVWAVAGDSGLSGAARAALFVAAGLYLGQVGHANAHELIHRGDRRLFRLGAAVYVALLFGHHASAHRHVHHRFVGTLDDPNTAVEGDGFWSYLPHAWVGSFRAGWAMETALRRQSGRGGIHPYAVWIGGAAAALLAIGAAFGWAGLAVHLALAAHAQMQILLSDYVQHYGLERRRLPGGRLEPVGPAHAWEARAAASGAMLLLAGRHADHHAHPGRPFPALEHAAAAPRLPYGLPVMGAIAMVPPLWHRVMDRRLARVRAAARAAVTRD
ncbi:MAG: alkane 1-monooxygenase [Gemmobacter sp.]